MKGNAVCVVKASAVCVVKASAVCVVKATDKHAGVIWIILYICQFCEYDCNTNRNTHINFT